MGFHIQGLLNRTFQAFKNILNRFVLLKIFSLLALVFTGMITCLVLVIIGFVFCLLTYDYILMGSLKEALGALSASSYPLFQSLYGNIVVIAALNALMYGLMLVIFLFFFRHVEGKKASFKELGVATGKGALKQFGMGMLIAAGWFIISVIAIWAILGMGLFTGQPSEIIFEFVQDSPAGILLSAALISASMLAVAIVEEIIFRGYILKLLTDKYGMMAGLLASSAIFAVIHFNPTGIITFFVFGAIAGYIYLLTRSLWACIGCHLLHNLTVFTPEPTPLEASMNIFTFGSSPASPNLYDVFSIVNFFAMAVTLVALWLFYIKKYNAANGDGGSGQAPATGDYCPTGFWTRVEAYLIDLMILGVIWVILAVPAYLIYGGQAVLSDLFALMMAVIEIAYYTYFITSEKQATPGKQYMGIVVVDGEGRRLTWKRSLGRAVLKVISEYLMIVLAGALIFIAVAFTAKKQSAYDMIMRTYVVNGKGRPVQEKVPMPLVGSAGP